MVGALKNGKQNFLFDTLRRFKMTNAAAIEIKNSNIVMDIDSRMKKVAAAMENERQLFEAEYESRQDTMFQLANAIDELKNNLIGYHQDLLALTDDFAKLGDNFDTLEEALELCSKA